MTSQPIFPELDRFDRAILQVLAADGRISITELARRIGLSKSPTQARVKRLEETGVITGYRALLDPIRMGLSHVAFVEVRLTDTREAALQAFNR
ncbi:MAG: Lrp/AsnC family transcriptional regulator, partial [Paracoccaceae bacterium]|nr:Lrp/AsnC family transcriptional regulator [Paracoccaceae bacterium]